MDNTHEIHLWSELYRQGALERARLRGLLKLAGGAERTRRTERGRVVLFREAGASETQLLPTVRHGL